MARPMRSNEGSGGKLVDTWYYEYQGIVDTNEDGEPKRPTVEPKKVAVELRIVKKYGGSDTPPLSTKEVWFNLVCKDPKFKLQGSDIESLRAAMWELLDEKFKVQWTDYFLVEINPSHPYDGMGTGFTFGYTRVEKGIAWDNTLLLRSRQYLTGEKIDPWPGEFRDKNGRVLACIPASKSNREALEAFSASIDKLRERLAEFLKPEHIEKTLANLNGTLLLAASDEKESDE